MILQMLKRLGGIYAMSTFIFGWANYKNYGSYGKRYYHPQDELLLGILPIILPQLSLIVLPYWSGHVLATFHDMLLYAVYPVDHQKLINNYLNSRQTQTILQAESPKNTGGKGIPQITYF